MRGGAADNPKTAVNRASKKPLLSYESASLSIKWTELIEISDHVSNPSFTTLNTAFYYKMTYQKDYEISLLNRL